MTEIDRRTWLAGAGAFITTPALAADTQPIPAYDYLFLDLADAEGSTPACRPRRSARGVTAREWDAIPGAIRFRRQGVSVVTWMLR